MASTYFKPKPGEEIVITGMSGRFADSSDIHHLRDNLFAKVDLVTADHRRWKPINPEIPQKTGKIFNAEKFDAGFFGIPQKHANNMDPMSRIVLELVFEAILDAGCNPLDFEGTNTDVFVATLYSETEKMTYFNNIKGTDSITGCQRSMMAKRISYFFKLKGAAFVSDSACSSSLVALDHAYRHLKMGLCEKAIVCGTQLCLHRIHSLQFARLGVLSSDGSCKVFDDAANGYARAEALVAMILEKSHDAKRTYAEIIHSKVNCDGYKEQGITFPSTEMQRTLLEELYQECEVDPSSLVYVETHGTGTKVGDREELTTLDNFFCRRRNRPLYIGSTKSNMGHTESASGLSSLVKVLVGFESGFIPPNIHYKTPRKGVEALQKGRVIVVADKMPWPDERGIVGVNSYGLGGVNAHVLLRWNRKLKINNGIPEDNSPRLVCASGRAEVTVAAMLAEAEKIDVEYISLVHQIFSRVIPNQLYNGYAIVSKHGKIENVICENRTFGKKLRIVFTNADQEWYHLGEKLMEFSPFFYSIQRAHEILKKEVNLNVSSILISRTSHTIYNTLGSVVVQLAMADIIKSLRLNISETVGIGYGELAAAYLDDYLTLNQALLIAYCISSGNQSKIKDIPIISSVPPDKWSPADPSPKHVNSYLRRSLDYFVKGVFKSTSFKGENEYKIRNNNVVNVIIGQCNENKTEMDILLVSNNISEPRIQLLQSLGRLFLLGFPGHLDNLYPKITYPVSRGTSMLSPYIKWNHSSNYTVHLCNNEEGRKSGEHVNHISLRIRDWRFLEGHVVDGRNLLPGTAYLYLVWQSYAIILDQLISDTSIVFEDVKFLRAINIPPDETVSLKVTIQLKSKVFEIIRDGALLVTGTVYLLDDSHKLVSPRMSLRGWGKICMNEDDVYKEMRLRGYNYSSQFRTIKKLDSTQNKAIISWDDNWITFVDNMFRLKLLSQDTRSVYVLTSINKLVIDRPRHIQQTAYYNNQLPVTYYKNMGIIAGGGIEINGLQASYISRRKPADPVLETYKFVPYHGKLKYDQAIRCMVQTILENFNTMKVKSTEVLEDHEEHESIMPLIQQTLNDLPLIQSELTILTKKEPFGLPQIAIKNKNLEDVSGCHILVVRNILEYPERISLALRATRDVSGYIITNKPKRRSFEKTPHIQMLCSYETEKCDMLLIKESSQYIERTPINLSSNDDLSWLLQLQTSINMKIVLYSQNSYLSGLLGLANCLRKELSGNNVSVVLILDSDAPLFNIKDDFYRSQLQKNLAINVFKEGSWGCYRYLVLPDAEHVEAEHCYVNITRRGDFSSLRWVEGPLSMMSIPDADQELVHIHYSAMNFRDIMMASGRIAVDVLARDTNLEERMQGLEFSGTLAHDSTKRVMGIVPSGALSTMVMADSKLLWPFPDQWSLEDAATVPMVYSTVSYGLLMRGRIKCGQSVLIHSGTGAVGQAAINVATHIGCTIFTTVSSQEKREFIKKHFPHIMEEHIGDSRSTSFEQMVLEYTEGKGVDFVLNSLAEEKLQASVRCLAYNGVFMEIGKFDLNLDNQLRTALLRKQGRFEGIVLEQLIVGIQETKEVLWKYVKEGISNGSVKPLVRTIFSREKVEDAFRFMTTGTHIGKVLIKVRNEEHVSQHHLFSGIPRFSSKYSGCYVIIGGLGGFGLELADWLITRGAKQLVLISRSGVKNGYQAHRLNIFKSYGIKVFVRNDDIGTEEGCMALLSFAESLSPVEGIFNLAVTLKDALFENQIVETFKVALESKAYSTRHLDTVSRKICASLRYFVVFSSVVCGRGNPGQTNYGMANSVMERICEKRKLDGYPATAIQWGAIGEVGVVAEMQNNREELVVGNTLQQRISNCLQILDQLLMQDEPIVSSMVIPEIKIESGSSNIFEVVPNIIGVKNLELVNIDATFSELGMDSIMAVEIQQILEREYKILLTLQCIRSMSMSRLKSLMTEQALPTSKSVQSNFETTPPDDLKLLLRYVGDEGTSNKPIIQTKSKHVSYGEPLVFALAGIEGMASAFEFIGKQLNVNLTCLQFCANNHSDSIEEIAIPLVKIVGSSTSTDFTIIAYSFGCLVATELMYALESLGKVGKAFFIDGAPEILVRLAKLSFLAQNDEVLQTELLFILMTRYLPFNVIINHKENITKQKTYKDKLKYVLNISPNINLSKKYFVDIYTAMLCRVKAVRKYTLASEKLNSVIMLAKPTKQMIVDIAHDYNLSSITKQPVGVKIIEGDHASILNHRQLVEEIQLFLDTDYSSK